MGGQEAVYDAHVGNVTKIIVSKDNAFMIASSEDGYIKTWDLTYAVTHASIFCAFIHCSIKYALHSIHLD